MNFFFLIRPYIGFSQRVETELVMDNSDINALFCETQDIVNNFNRKLTTQLTKMRDIIKTMKEKEDVMQTQLNIYQEDFKKERQDREKAQETIEHQKRRIRVLCTSPQPSTKADLTLRCNYCGKSYPMLEKIKFFEHIDQCGKKQ